MILNRYLLSLLVLTLILTFCSCGHYSFQGVTVKGPIVIHDFYNNTDLGPANMGQDFTNSLKDYFIQNSSISVVRDGGSLELDGEISQYTLTPVAPTVQDDPNTIDYAASTRLTITVKATYRNGEDETMGFENKGFSFFKEFSNDENLTDIEEELIKEIFDQIILDIFNASVANW